jgi:hypothetical protein
MADTPGNRKTSNGAPVKDAAGQYMHDARQAGAECLAAALDYLALGWSALALCPPDHVAVGKAHGKHCKNPGKVPWGLWDDFQDRLPTEDVCKPSGATTRY